MILGKHSGLQAPFDTQSFWLLFASHQTLSSSRGTEGTCLRSHSHLVAKLSLGPQQPWVSCTPTLLTVGAASSCISWSLGFEEAWELGSLHWWGGAGVGGEGASISAVFQHEKSWSVRTQGLG